MNIYSHSIYQYSKHKNNSRTDIRIDSKTDRKKNNKTYNNLSYTNIQYHSKIPIFQLQQSDNKHIHRSLSSKYHNNNQTNLNPQNSIFHNTLIKNQSKIKINRQIDKNIYYYKNSNKIRSNSKNSLNDLLGYFNPYQAQCNIINNNLQILLNKQKSLKTNSQSSNQIIKHSRNDELKDHNCIKQKKSLQSSQQLQCYNGQYYKYNKSMMSLDNKESIHLYRIYHNITNQNHQSHHINKCQDNKKMKNHRKRFNWSKLNKQQNFNIVTF